ncbi:hypothetical protein [Sulfurimonas sp. HSL3-7]|uniref:hypothetical protein n=1 Tax=Sulfonitrofixus jiaomeiensis TaxID=3131938 RepID=UPI0031F96243
MKVLFKNKDELLYLSTKKSFLTLLITVAFLTGCQEDANQTSSSTALAPKVKTTLPPGLAKKTTTETEPVVEETLPVVEETQPVVEETLPVVEETQPVIEETLPVVEETQPVVEETLPVVEETLPVVEETQPVVEETLPVVEETQPVVEETLPVVEETQPVVAVCVEGDAMIEGHVTDKATGSGLADVQINVGGCATATDENGYFTLSNIAETENAVVNFEKEGYLLGSTRIQVDLYAEGTTTASSNYLEYAIGTYTSQWSYDSQTAVAGAHLDIPTDVYADMSGNAYHGTVTAGLKIVDVTTEEGKELFPGTFEGKNVNGETVLFSSYGLISLSLKDTGGNALNLADGATATLTFDAVTSLEEKNIIPLWYYDYSQGTWIEEGYAELQSDGTYVGSISHVGTWSLNMPLETSPGTYRGRIVYSDGVTVKDARVALIGPNWMRSDLSTDADGLFEVTVVPGDDFQIVAYNYKWKYEAAHANVLPAVASGEIVEDRI